MLTKKEKILKITLQLIAEQGIQATPMSQIAKESSVAIGTIYHHFKSKEEILDELYISKKLKLQSIILEFLDERKSVQQQFTEIWLGIYQFYTSNHLLFRFVQQIDNNPFSAKNDPAEDLKYYLPLYNFFQKGMDSGQFVTMDLRLMTELIHDNICTLATIKIEGKSPVNEQHVQSAIAFSWNAIKNK